MCRGCRMRRCGGSRVCDGRGDPPLSARCFLGCSTSFLPSVDTGLGGLGVRMAGVCSARCAPVVEERV